MQQISHHLYMLPKISRQIGFIIVPDIVAKVQIKTIREQYNQNWGKIKTFPLYVFAVATSVIVLLEHLILHILFKLHGLFKLLLQVVDICVLFIWIERKRKIYMLPF